MADSITIQSVLSKISQDHLECSICSDRFAEPKVLDCLHTFCSKCLRKLIQHTKQGSSSLSCPLCRRKTVLEAGEVTSLPNNFTLSALVEEVTMQEKFLEGQGSEIKCQSCEEGNQANSQCMDCNHFLCQECQTAHKRMAALKTHKIFTLAQLRSGEVVYKSKLREKIPKCAKHADQNLNIYCNTCEQSVCTTCSVLDHAKHSLTGLPEAFDKCKQEVADIVAKCTTELKAAVENAEKYRKNLDSAFDDTNKNISRKADQDVARIRRQEDKQKKDVKKIYEKRVKTIETAQADYSKAAQKLQEVNRLMDQASQYEILDLKQKLKQNLSDLTKEWLETLPAGLTSLDLEESEGSHGGSVTDDKWRLETTLHKCELYEKFGCLKDIAAFSNGDLVVVDTQHRQLFSISLKSSPVSSPISLLVQGHSPSHVAVNKDDQIIFVQGPLVNVLAKNLHHLHEFRPGRVPYSTPTCLAVDENNVIAVGFMDKNVICLHTPKGSLIKTVSAPLIRDCLTICKQQFIYTNWKKRRLVSVDYYGRLVFSVDNKSDPGQKSGPDGVCCDDNGNIYILARKERGLDEIHHYSPKGAYVECAIKNCNDAWGITFTPSGKLAVAAGNTVKIYCRV